MNSDVRIVARDRRDSLGEGSLWSVRDQALYWVDILDFRVNHMTLDGAVSTWQLDDYVGWVIERESGGLVAGVGQSFVRLSLDPLEATPIATPQPTLDGHRVNDAKADAQGRIWAGIMPIRCDAPTGSFYRLDPDGTVTRVDRPYTIPNGPAISPDNRWLLHTDTEIGTIFRFDINDDGSLGQRAPFIDFQAGWGSPDGMTFDAEGGLWVACWGGSGVRRFTPEGHLDRVIALPASQITSCTFAGPDLDRMFVTSASIDVDEPEGGALFEIDPGVRGLAAGRYRG